MARRCTLSASTDIQISQGESRSEVVIKIRLTTKQAWATRYLASEKEIISSEVAGKRSTGVLIVISTCLIYVT